MLYGAFDNVRTEARSHSEGVMPALSAGQAKSITGIRICHVLSSVLHPLIHRFRGPPSPARGKAGLRGSLCKKIASECVSFIPGRTLSLARNGSAPTGGFQYHNQLSFPVPRCGTPLAGQRPAYSVPHRGTYRTARGAVYRIPPRAVYIALAQRATVRDGK